MTGYMSVLKNNVFDGRFLNGAAAPVANGIIMKVNTTGDKLVLPGSADAAFTCIGMPTTADNAVTTIFGAIPAVEYLVTATGAAQYYFVENQFDINDSMAYDTTEYTVAVGKFLRAHPIEAGERFIVAGTKTGAVSLKADGTVG